ncbi:MAG: hypothetical protein AAGC83_06120 [Pseudomonadota bacterium]
MSLQIIVDRSPLAISGQALNPQIETLTDGSVVIAYAKAVGARFEIFVQKLTIDEMRRSRPSGRRRRCRQAGLLGKMNSTSMRHRGAASPSPIEPVTPIVASKYASKTTISTVMVSLSENHAS